MKWSYTWELIKEDFCNSCRTISLLGKISVICFNLEFQILLLCRLLSFFQMNRRSRWLIPPLLYFQRILSGCHISPYAKIGHRVKFPHPTGVVIGENVQIGDGVKIFQHVTLGSHGKPGQEMGYPIIESDVIIFASAIIIGSVSVGHKAVIGAGSLVLNDVPPYAVVAGVPAKVLRFRTDIGDESGLDNNETFTY